MQHTEAELDAIYTSIAAPQAKLPRPSRPFDGAKRKWLRVYTGPAYPTDPRLEQARALDAYINVFMESPAPRTYDHTSFLRWIADNAN